MNSEVTMVDNLDNDVDYWKDETEEPVYYSDSVSLSTVSTQDSEVNKNKVKTRFGVSYKNDKHYFKIKSRKKGAPSITGFSTTMLPGATIRNVVTGYLECDYAGKPIYKVGTKDENLFFKANISVNGITEEPRILFYDNPEQYERHFKVNVSIDTKKRWQKKYNQRLKVIEKSKNTVGYYHEV